MIANVLIIFIIMATFFNAIALVTNYRSANDLRVASQNSASPSFKSRYDILGAQVVEAWLMGSQPVVETIEGVVWPTVTETSTTGEDVGTGIQVTSVGYLGGQTVLLDGSDDFHESLSYSVVAEDGTQYVAAIDMGVIRDEDGNIRPVLLSAPLVEPRVDIPIVAGVGAPAWEVFSAGENSAVAAQVAEWVSAWTTNDTSALKTLTGDTSESVYVGMQSLETWEIPEDASVTISWAAVRPEDGNVVVRAIWDIQTPEPELEPGTTAEESGERDANGDLIRQKTIRQSVDLLIEDADTGLPKIVAWGAPGTYADLEPYQNAVEGEE